MNQQLTEEQVLQKHIGVVKHFAKKYVHSAKTVGLEFEDIFSAGCIGLLKAYRRYENNRTTHFRTFAFHYVKGEILAEISRTNAGLKYPKYIREVAMSIAKRDMEESTPEQIAEVLKTNIEWVLYALEYLNTSMPMKLDTPLLHKEEPLTLLDVLGVETDFTNNIIGEFIEQSTDMEIKVLALKIEGVSFHGMARELNCKFYHVKKAYNSLYEKAVEYFHTPEVIA